MKVKNISSEVQAIPGIPAFEANEERGVTQELGDLILRNPYFVEAKKKKEETFKAIEA